ncbi:hypothetical protein ACFUN7_24430 [Streptomyces sp. NPDC057236]|uniref:hypothetical protein n=1 Tax=Streptomyces sp. NPDC057236 TaxID=3346059 RepID=UPI00363CB4F9
MPGISDAALTVIRAALEDAHRLGENHADGAARVVLYLISEGYTITPDLSEPAAA